jgi:hypothetical protein
VIIERRPIQVPARLCRIAEMVDDRDGAVEIVVAAVAAARDHHRDPGATRREQSIARVLDGDGVGGGNPDLVEHLMVDVRGRLLKRHAIAGGDRREAGGTLRPK